MAEDFGVEMMARACEWAWLMSNRGKYIYTAAHGARYYIQLLVPIGHR